MRRDSKLELTTPSEDEIRVTRVFDAPIERVFDAFTKPELFREWIVGDSEWTLETCEMNLRAGHFRFAWAGPNGQEKRMNGRYAELDPPNRMVELIDNHWTGSSTRVTTELAALEGTTRMTVTTRFDERSARDRTLAAGVEESSVEAYDRLEALLRRGTPSVADAPSS
jgi:uncharacterized protein YndB with AHSA1/START domain